MRHPHIPPVQAFFSDLLRAPGIAGNLDFLDTLLRLGQQYKVVEALHAAKEKQHERFTSLEKALAKHPLGPEGKWVTVPEIEALQYGYSEESLAKKLCEHKQAFPSQETGEGAKYYLCPDNVAFLDSTGKSRIWYKSALALKLARAEFEETKSWISQLERERKEEKKLGVQVKSLPRKALDLEKGVRLSVRQIKEYGSTIKYQVNIGAKMRKHKEELHAQKEGHAWFATITNANCHLVGLAHLRNEDAKAKVLDSLLPVNGKPYTLYGDSGLWMDVAEIKEQGSAFHESYLRLKLHKEASFHAEKVGKQLCAWITPFNFERADLPYFPGAPILPEPALTKQTAMQETDAEHTQATANGLPDIYRDEKGTVWGKRKALFDLGPTRASANSLYQYFHANKERFSQRRVGKRETWFGITPENASEAGFTTWPPATFSQLECIVQGAGTAVQAEQAQPAPTASEPKAPAHPQQHTHYIPLAEKLAAERTDVFLVDKAAFKLDQGRSYPITLVRRGLQQLDKEMFTQPIVDRALQYMRANTHVQGNELIPFLDKVRGILPLLSKGTKKKLEAEVSGGFQCSDAFLAEMPTNIHYQRFVHTFPEVLGDTAYIIAGELGSLVLSVRIHEDIHLKPDSSQQQRRIDSALYPKDAEALAALESFKDQLVQQRLVPTFEAHTRLLELGVLSHSSRDAVTRSYTRFIEEMKGWQFYPFPPLRKSLGLDWNEFNARYLSMLEKEGLVKDLAKATSKGEHFYVAKQGQGHVIEAKIRGLVKQMQTV